MMQLGRNELNFVIMSMTKEKMWHVNFCLNIEIVVLTHWALRDVAVISSKVKCSYISVIDIMTNKIIPRWMSEELIDDKPI